jgi:hypothetical protein
MKLRLARRALAENYVYFSVEGDASVTLSIWGAPRKGGPKL